MLTPERNANSRWRGSPGTIGSMAWPSWRVAQAPARSFEVMMMEDTPSPARAGRLLSSSVSLPARQRFDPELAGVEAAGEVAQQEECLGQHVLARHRLELGDVERRQDGAQRDHAGRAVGAAGAGRRHDGVAGVEQDGAAVLHVGVDARERWRATASARSARSASRSAGRTPVRRARCRVRPDRRPRARCAAQETPSAPAARTG